MAPKRTLWQWHEAIDWRVSREASPDARLLWASAAVLCRLELPEQARSKLDRAIALDDTYILAHLLAGRVLLEVGFAMVAEERFKRVIEVLDPSSDRAYAGLGSVYLALDNYLEASRMFKTAAKLTAGTAECGPYLIDLGGSAQECGEFSLAQKAYDEVFALDAKFGLHWEKMYWAHRGFASMELELRKSKDAISHCEEGLSILDRQGYAHTDEAAALHFLIGAAEHNLHRFDDALSRFHSAGEISDKFKLHAMALRAATYSGQGKYEKAWSCLAPIEETFEQLQKEGKLDEGQRMTYGSAQLWLDEFDKAEEVFRAILDGGRSTTAVRMRLFELYLARRECATGNAASDWHWRARECYRQVVDDLEQQYEDTSYSRLLESLGLMHLMMEDPVEAKRRLGKAAGQDAVAVAPHVGLGMIHLEEGEAKDAIKEFKLAENCDPHDLRVKCQLANAHFRNGSNELALNAFQEVIEIANGDVVAHIGAGEVLIAMAEESADDDLLGDAESHLTAAICLTETVKPEGARRGSTSLGLRQSADLYYQRGYVRAKIFENTSAGTLGRPSKPARGRLKGAQRDFQKAKGFGVARHRADRALQVVKRRSSLTSPGALAESWAPTFVALVTVVLLIVVQVEFYGSGGFSRGKNPVGYTTLSVSLLVLLAVAFYLPHVLKMKFGGLEIEKAGTPQSAREALNIARLGAKANLFSKPAPGFGGFKNFSPPGSSSRRSQAARGAGEEPGRASDPLDPDK